MERHARVDRCPTIELRFDEKRSLYQLQSFFHTDEAKPSTHLRCLGVKTDATVTHTEMNLIGCPPQSDVDLSGPAVLYRVTEGFLQHSEETKRNIRRH